MKSIVIAIALLVTMPALGYALPPSEAEADPSTPEVDHRSAPDPIRVTLEAATAPRVGETFVLRATLVASWVDLQDATITIALPDAITAEGATKATADLTLGEPVVVEFPLTVLAEGSHALHAFASAPFGHEGTLGGERTAYVVVPAEGDGAFHQDLVPRKAPRTLAAPAAAEPAKAAAFGTMGVADKGAAPGASVPAKLPAEEPRDPLESGDDGDGFTTMGHATFTVSLCWFYENEASPAVDTPQRYATVQVWDEDDFSDDLLAEGVTGNDGCYTSPPIGREDTSGGAGNQDVFVRIHLCNTWVCVQDSDEDFYVYRVDFGTVGSQDEIFLGSFKAPGGDAFGARAFQYANNAGYFAVNHMQAPGFSSSGPRVTMWAPSTDDSCDGGGMFFRRSENRIHVCSDSDRSPEDIGHEFGHWLHWTLYGYSFWPSPGGPHNLCTDSQNRGLSWTEGFGNFYGPRVGNEVNAPGADNNVNYDRPWDGSSISINMETGTCGTFGDDNERQVAHTLWDIRDTAVDGLDTLSASNAFIASVVAACDDNNFRDFFDGGSCSWISQGGDGCTFMRAAAQNNIDFNDNAPTVAVTSQNAFAWVRGILTITANANDPDPGCVPSVEFRVSNDSSCTATDTLVGTDTTAPYSRTFDTTTIADNADVWTCARASDGIDNSAWDASASPVGIDNTPPNVGSSLGGTHGNAGWWRSAVTATLSCTDNLAGVASLTYRIGLGPSTTYTAPVVISAEGVHLLSYRCEDNAGNVDTGSDIVRIDTRDPSTAVGHVGAAGENGWYVGDVTVAMACSDPTPGSGCFNTQVMVTSPGGAGGIFDYAAPFTLTGDGVHTVDYHSVDVAGNVETAGSLDIAIDTMPPTGEIAGATDGTFVYEGAYVLGGLFTNEASLTVGYHVTDAASGIQRVWVVGGDADDHTGELDVNGELTLALPPGLSSWTLMVEDMAGHTATFGTFDVVLIPAGTFAGGVDPRTAGWWKNAVKYAYAQDQLDAMTVLVNVVSHAFGGPDDRYAPITPANYATYLQNSPSTGDERVRKELAAAWLNLVSGREPAAQAVDLARVAGWETVVTNTGGSSQTLALNVVLQAEQRLRESPNHELLNTIKSVLSMLNSGGVNV